MPSSDENLIARIHQETCQYLDRLESSQPIWADLDMHIAASHLAENLGDETAMASHLQDAARLLAEAWVNSPVPERLGKKNRLIVRKPAGRCRATGPFEARRVTTSRLKRVAVSAG
jgi:hypothetical protein